MFKNIAFEYVPYLNDQISDLESNSDDVFDFIDELIDDKTYDILDKPKIIEYTKNMDDVIVESVIMNRTQKNISEVKKIVAGLI